MKLAIAIIAIVASYSVHAQSHTFQDLNFEEANIVPISGQPGLVSVANGLPGWTVDYGNVQQTQINYNGLSLGATAATLEAATYPASIAVLDGNYSIVLQGSVIEGVGTPVSISQTGQIPLGTQSLFFDGPIGPGLQVSLGNDNLTLFTVGSGVSNDGIDYSIYGADIGTFAGQTEQLSFTLNTGAAVIDDISFSPGAVPEPSPFALTGIGGILFALYRRFASKRR